MSIIGADTLAGRDVRRFRPNVVVAGTGEDALVGSHRRLGNAELHIEARIVRCVMVTRPQPGIDRDLGVLKEIIRNSDTRLSVGATVSLPGEVAVGDELA